MITARELLDCLLAMSADERTILTGILVPILKPHLGLTREQERTLLWHTPIGPILDEPDPHAVGPDPEIVKRLVEAMEKVETGAVIAAQHSAMVAANVVPADPPMIVESGRVLRDKPNDRPEC
jgi:hypothetical protein